MSGADPVRDQAHGRVDEEQPPVAAADCGGAEGVVAAAYAAYNSQDLEALTALVSADVDWPAGAPGAGRMHGAAAVRDFWREQWRETRTQDVPAWSTCLHQDAGGGRLLVRVRVEQVVEDLQGVVLGTGTFDHVHEVRDGRITRLDIAEPAAPDEQHDAVLPPSEPVAAQGDTHQVSLPRSAVAPGGHVSLPVGARRRPPRSRRRPSPLEDSQRGR